MVAVTFFNRHSQVKNIFFSVKILLCAFITTAILF